MVTYGSFRSLAARCIVLLTAGGSVYVRAYMFACGSSVPLGRLVVCELIWLVASMRAYMATLWFLPVQCALRLQ